MLFIWLGDWHASIKFSSCRSVGLSPAQIRRWSASMTEFGSQQMLHSYSCKYSSWARSAIFFHFVPFASSTDIMDLVESMFVKQSCMNFWIFFAKLSVFSFSSTPTCADIQWSTILFSRMLSYFSDSFIFLRWRQWVNLDPFELNTWITALGVNQHCEFF